MVVVQVVETMAVALAHQVKVQMVELECMQHQTTAAAVVADFQQLVVMELQLSAEQVAREQIHIQRGLVQQQLVSAGITQAAAVVQHIAAVEVQVQAEQAAVEMVQMVEQV